MFLITGFIFAVIVPVINLDILGFKGFLYSFIMIVFAMLVFAYVILSVYKFKISRIDYLKSKTIVSWNVDIPENKKTKLPYCISLISGLCLGIFVYFKGAGLLNSVLFSLACAFTVLGWWLMGRKRLEQKMKSTDSFLLSHMGVIYNGNAQVFNGYTKGILGAEKENNTLILKLLKNKKESELKIEIPEEKKEDVVAFINDLKEYFSGENNEK